MHLPFSLGPNLLTLGFLQEIGAWSNTSSIIQVAAALDIGNNISGRRWHIADMVVCLGISKQSSSGYIRSLSADMERA